MNNNHRKINFCAQGQRWTARVLLIVWLCVSGGSGNALAVTPFQALVGLLSVFGSGVSLLHVSSGQLGVSDPQSCPNGAFRELKQLQATEVSLSQLRQGEYSACKPFFDERGASNVLSEIESGNKELFVDFNGNTPIELHDELAQAAVLCLAKQDPTPNILQLVMAHKQGWKNLPRAIGELGTLEALIVPSNGLEALPARIAQLARLLVLDLSSNSLEALPARIAQLERLLVLYVSGNDLQSLPDLLPPNLRALDVSGNNLQSLPDLLPPNLRALYASGNNLQSFPPLPPNLQVLDASHNNFTNLSSMLSPNPKDLLHLTRIDISGNNLENLEELSRILVDLPSLQQLNLSKNKFRDLPRLLKGLLALPYRPGLQWVDITGNPINYSLLDGSSLTILQELLERGVKIAGIPEDIQNPYIELNCGLCTATIPNNTVNKDETINKTCTILTNAASTAAPSQGCINLDLAKAPYNVSLIDETVQGIASLLEACISLPLRGGNYPTLFMTRGDLKGASAITVTMGYPSTIISQTFPNMSQCPSANFSLADPQLPATVDEILG